MCCMLACLSLALYSRNLSIANLPLRHEVMPHKKLAAHCKTAYQSGFKLAYSTRQASAA